MDPHAISHFSLVHSRCTFAHSLSLCSLAKWFYVFVFHASLLHFHKLDLNFFFLFFCSLFALAHIILMKDFYTFFAISIIHPGLCASSLSRHITLTAPSYNKYGVVDYECDAIAFPSNIFYDVSIFCFLLVWFGDASNDTTKITTNTIHLLFLCCRLWKGISNY